MENRKYGPGWRRADGENRSGFGTRSSGLETDQKSTACEEKKNMPEESGEKGISSFRDLIIWQTGKDLVVDVYRLTKTFPQEEKFGLSDQMRRAAVSIPCNIAEGFNRKYSSDYKRFLFIALGSCGEIETQLEIAASLQLIGQDSVKKILEKIDHESRMIRKLLEKIQSSIVERKNTFKKTSPESLAILSVVRCALCYRLGILSNRSCPHAASISWPTV